MRFTVIIDRDLEAAKQLRAHLAKRKALVQVMTEKDRHYVSVVGDLISRVVVRSAGRDVLKVTITDKFGTFEVHVNGYIDER